VSDLDGHAAVALMLDEGVWDLEEIVELDDGDSSSCVCGKEISVEYVVRNRDTGRREILGSSHGPWLVEVSELVDSGLEEAEIKEEAARRWNEKVASYKESTKPPRADADKLAVLAEALPNNTFVASVSDWVDAGRTFTKKQRAAVRRLYEELVLRRKLAARAQAASRRREIVEARPC
jgi:hypothetical protein